MQVAESLGYTVKKVGKYHTLKEMDSIRIYNRSHWYRWSDSLTKATMAALNRFLTGILWNECKRGCVLAFRFCRIQKNRESCKAATCSSGIAEADRREKAICPTRTAGDNSYLISYLNQERESAE